MMQGVQVPQLGQVKIDSSTTSVMAISPLFLHEPWHSQHQQ
jgi:hypothetical protein